MQNKSVVADLVYQILNQAQQYGAELIVTSCPLCAFNLDTRQKEVQKKYKEFESIPVLYSTQIMALALGLDKEQCGVNLNYIDPEKFFKNKNYL